LTGGARVTISSDSGALQRNAQILELAGAVALVQDHGYEFHTSRARIDLGQHTASGDSPVEGRGPQGEVHAEGFTIDNDGARVVFLGRSRALFRPQSGQATP
jgi:lipopolysaccharide export system protein LptC